MDSPSSGTNPSLRRPRRTPGPRCGQSRVGRWGRPGTHSRQGCLESSQSRPVRSGGRGTHSGPGLHQHPVSVGSVLWVSPIYTPLAYTQERTLCTSTPLRPVKSRVDLVDGQWWSLGGPGHPRRDPRPSRHFSSLSVNPYNGDRGLWWDGTSAPSTGKRLPPTGRSSCLSPDRLLATRVLGSS